MAIWDFDTLWRELTEQGINYPTAHEVAEKVFPSTEGNEDFRGIAISTTLGPPVGAYGIYENLRLGGWPFGHSPIRADAMIIRRHYKYETAGSGTLNFTIFGVRPPITMPEPLPDIRERWGPEPRGTVGDLLRVAEGWRNQPHRWTQVLRDQNWNNLVSYLQDHNLYGG